MPKPIKLTPEWIQKMVAEFTRTLSDLKLSDGKVSYVKALTYEKDDEEGATILFEPIAYAKTLMLLDRFDKEVAWHGTVERMDKKTFLVKDIFVYPQEVTGGTVTTDQERYQTWLMKLDDDTFNALHMQGHSHVRMGTTPSPVDEKFYDSILEQLSDEDYYIFMVFNKSLQHTIKIYDMENNVLYEDKDISLGIRCEGGDLESFIVDAKDDVVEKTTITSAGFQSTTNTKYTSGKEAKKNAGEKPAGNNQGISRYPGYYGGYGGYGGHGGTNPANGNIVDYDAEIFGRRQDWWNE